MPMARDATQLAVPDGWRVVRLGEVASRRKEQVKPEKNDPQPYVALEHIVPGGALSGHGRAGESISNKTLFKKGDTLYGKLRPNLRKVIRAEFGGVCSTDILAIFGSEQVGDPFLSHLLRSDLIHQHAMQGVAGTKMPRTSWNHLSRFKFPVPPLAEQRGIAAVLDAIDEAIERSEAVVAVTEELRRSLLHELLSRGVPGRHSEWREVRGLGVVPACWEVVRLGEVAEVRSGTGFPLARQGRRSGAYPFIKVSDMTLEGNETYIRTANNYVDDDDARDLRANIFAPDTVVFPKVGAAIATNKKRALTVPTIIDNNMVGITVSDAGTCDARFLHNWLESIDLSQVANVSTVPSITGSRLKREPLPLPPLAEQRLIAGGLDGVDRSLAQARTGTDVLRSLKASVSEALLSGRVRVAAEKRA